MIVVAVGVEDGIEIARSGRTCWSRFQSIPARQVEELAATGFRLAEKTLKALAEVLRCVGILLT